LRKFAYTLPAHIELRHAIIHPLDAFSRDGAYEFPGAWPKSTGALPSSSADHYSILDAETLRIPEKVYHNAERFSVEARRTTTSERSTRERTAPVR